MYSFIITKVCFSNYLTLKICAVAYATTYGSDPVWLHYRRNFKGQFAPPETRKTCIVRTFRYNSALTYFEVVSKITYSSTGKVFFLTFAVSYSL